MIYPDFFARFYDVIYASLRSDIDFEYFQKKIIESNGPVLEIGVGTGRFFIEALKKGADIYGIDISPSMIEILKSKISPINHFRVKVDNAISFSSDKQFDLIIAPFRVFMHIINIEDQINCLKNIYSHLIEGGIFIFDAYIPNPLILANGINNIVDFEGEYENGKKVRRIVTANNDIVNQLNNITFTIEWEEEKGKWCRDIWHTQLHFFFKYEIENLLRLSPFKKYKILGDYSESQLNSNSKDFVIVCEK